MKAHQGAPARSPPFLRTVHEALPPQEKGPRTRRGCGLGWSLLSVPTTESGDLGGNTVGASPQVRRTTPRNHHHRPTVRRARGPGSRTSARRRVATQEGMKWSRPFPRGPWESGGNRGPCGTGTSQPLARRGSRDKKVQKEAGGGFAPRNRGEGPEERVRAPSARMQHCDKAARAQGWEAGERGYRCRAFPYVSHI